MSRRFRLSLLIVCRLRCWSSIVLLGLYLAARHEPAFYREAMEADRAVLEKGSDRMLRKTAALAKHPQKPGRWEIRITAEEINGWLAVDMPKNHPHALPPTLHDPRVVIDPNEITVACRFQQNGIDSVLSLTVQPYVDRSPTVPNANVVAVRIVGARAGLLPLPLDRVLERPFAGRPRHAVPTPVAQRRRRPGGHDLPARRRR